MTKRRLSDIGNTRELSPNKRRAENVPYAVLLKMLDDVIARGEREQPQPINDNEEQGTINTNDQQMTEEQGDRNGHDKGIDNSIDNAVLNGSIEPVSPSGDTQKVAGDHIQVSNQLPTDQSHDYKLPFNQEAREPLSNVPQESNSSSEGDNDAIIWSIINDQLLAQY